MKKITQFFKALSDETRLQIIALILWQEELCVCDIERILNLTQSKASRHLRYLLNSNIFVDKRVGVSVYYSFSKELDEFQKKTLDNIEELFKETDYKELKDNLDNWLEKNTCNTCRA
jgi:ArsR family transcriptional regulator